MEINHVKLEKVDSTQGWIKENISNHLGENLLVSAQHQTNGIGRMGNKWSQFGSSAAFSFTLDPIDPVTLTPLELGVHIVDFFHLHGLTLQLKWPNDLLIEQDGDLKKVGGIICNFHNQEVLLVGIGINLDQSSLPDNSDFKFKPGAIDFKLEDFHELPHKIYKHILANRLNKTEVQNLWNKYCCHYKTKVKIIDDSLVTEGLFLGIGDNGEAIIEKEGQDKKIFSGSLWILS